MKVCVVILVLFLMTSEQALVQASSSESSSEPSSSSECTSDVDNKVTEAEFLSQIATGYWLDIYSVLIGGSVSRKQKINNRWSQSDALITREINLSITNTCFTFMRTFSATETECGVQLNQAIPEGVDIERFYSQDLGSYFWWLTCINPTNNDCISGKFELHIRDTRVMNEGEIDLTGLPWGKIAADLVDIRNVSFGDINGPKYIWLGKECPMPPES